MEYSLSCLLAVVDYYPIGIAKPHVFCNFSGFQQQVTKQGLVFVSDVRKSGNRRFGNNEYMSRCLRADIVKCKAKVIFEYNFSRDFPADDFGKDRITHGELPEVLGDAEWPGTLSVQLQ